MARLTSERDGLRKEAETKNHDILEKNKTITQVKKIGRRYKTQYEELKVQHDKVCSPSTPGSSTSNISSPPPCVTVLHPVCNSAPPCV